MALPQLNLLHHRGPDGSGEWTNKNGSIYLGHTRLAILEPTPAGKQPMVNASKRYTITFNGEIYNHLQLRSLLPGINWRGNSDTETLVELMAAKGLAGLGTLKGMFAFALHDSEDDSVLLVRDRMGIKPLWYRCQDTSIQFSSEIRVLLEAEKTQLTDAALSEYISFGRLPESGEIVAGVQPVSPGSWIKIKGGEGTCAHDRIAKGTWWPEAADFKPKLKNRQEWVAEVNKLVSTAVEEHLISDVGVGAFLSGGIDSSIVTLIAGKLLGRRLQTFTIGFPQKTFDERSIARVVAKKAGSEHTELEIQPEACLTWVKEAVVSLDLPSVDAINTYIVSKAVRDCGLKVALSGLGGDELFGGYPSFRSVPWLRLLDVAPSISRQLIRALPRSIKQKLGGIPDFSTPNLTSARRRFTSVSSLKQMGLTSGVPIIPPPPFHLDTMGKISWAEIYGYMVPMLLRDSDQMSMAVGLEIRVPFLDHCLVEAVLGCPQKYKAGPGIKPLLVEAFRSELPQEVYNRPKQGFALPMDEWLRGPLSDFLNEGITAAADSLSLSEPLQLLESFHKGHLHWARVWNWSVLGHWLGRKSNAAGPL
ncbi:asparagine synthase (glutamine-hydrolyzing) [Hymenobacter sp. BT188]|nr:asparagine synthase (glutamine-hydrolyzing) [Hymenobacter sp. BT188]